MMFGKMSARFLLCTLLAASAAGCATADRRLMPNYRPSAHASGGSGNVYVAVPGGYAGDRNARIQYILGKIKNTDGETTGNIVTQVAPADIVQQAFAQELNEAGYGAIPVNVLPEGVAKGVEISSVAIDMEEVGNVMKSEVTGKLNVAVEVWKNGSKIRRLDYKTTTSKFAVSDKDRLAQDVLEGSLQDIMKQAVPDVINVLEEK